MEGLAFHDPSHISPIYFGTKPIICLPIGKDEEIAKPYSGYCSD
jgi:hypothetical protein